MTSVLIVDDHPVILRGFRRIMEDAGVETVHEATDIVGGYRLFHRLRPGMVVADLTFRTGALAGLSLIRQIRALERDTRILAFSMHDDPVIVSRALESGATGYVLKDVPAAQFHAAFETVRAGRSYLDHDLATRVAVLGLAGQRAPLADLTARELQILSLLGRGQSYQTIADGLAVSYRTVIGASASLRHKLGVRTLAELIHVAVSQGEGGLTR
ncbi:two-component system response regulator [Methylobacterium sp. Leaf102]|uniref:response regulator n=1 Tax=Methylobacterium sp. Leaf102 TaxID=1736253 RepID=UPI0006FF6204|nr:response regulator transcription factor [Methylobacterium sp. Leaf102]KQP32600.1 two-component system response regulator [Methylobacterium sp. Leaf102]